MYVHKTNCFMENKNSSILKDQALKLLEEIIYYLPKRERELIEEAYAFRRIPKEYLLSSILFAYSNACGLAFSIKSLGHINYANLYFALIGSRGDMKSPSMDLATAALNEYDNKMYSKYLEELECNTNENEPKRTQLFLQDATIEAACLRHKENPYSCGILMDEIYSLIEKMGNPNSRDGSDWRKYFLQGNTNKHIDITRKTTLSFRIKRSYPTLLGSIQTEFIPKIFAGGNLESGFVDRLLFSIKLTENNKLSKKSISEHVQTEYNENVLRVLELRKQIETNSDEETLLIKCSEKAEDRMHEYKQGLINLQNTVNNTESAYISKMQINIHKIVLLLHIIKSSEHHEYNEPISVTTVEHAIAIVDFYFLNFKLVLKEKGKKNNAIDKNEIIRMGLKNEADQVHIAKVIGMDKSTVSRRIKQYNLQPATVKNEIITSQQSDFNTFNPLK